MSAPLDKLRFVFGEWKGRAEGQFGEKGIIESKFEVARDPSERFITSRGSTRSATGPRRTGWSWTLSARRVK